MSTKPVHLRKRRRKIQHSLPGIREPASSAANCETPSRVRSHQRWQQGIQQSCTQQQPAIDFTWHCHGKVRFITCPQLGCPQFWATTLHVASDRVFHEYRTALRASDQQDLFQNVWTSFGNVGKLVMAHQSACPAKWLRLYYPEVYAAHVYHLTDNGLGSASNMS